MLYSETVAVCFAKYLEHINVLYGQKDELSVKTHGKHNDRKVFDIQRTVHHDTFLQ